MENEVMASTERELLCLGLILLAVFLIRGLAWLIEDEKKTDFFFKNGEWPKESEHFKEDKF